MLNKNKSACLETKKGFTLVEVLFSLLILSFGVVGIYSLMMVSIKASADAKNQVIASGLAQEGIEIVRNLKDNGKLSPGIQYQKYCLDYRLNKDNFVLGTYFYSILLNGNCKLYLNSGLFNLNSAGTVTKFNRVIDIGDDGTLKTIKSTVWWNSDPNTVPAVCNLANKCTAITSVIPR